MHASGPLRPVAAGLAVFLLLAAPAGATFETNWMPATGNWSTPGQWDAGEPAYDPDDPDTWANAVIENGGTVTVDEAGEVCYNLGIGWRGGSGTLELTDGNLTVADTSIVGSWGTATFVQSGGTHTCDAVRLGWSVGSHGEYELSDGQLNTNFIELGIWEAEFTQSGGACTTTGGLRINERGTWALSGNAELDAGFIESYGQIVQTGGACSVDGDVTLRGAFGAPDPVARYDLSGTSSLTAENLNVASGGAAVFTQAGGTVTVRNTLTLSTNYDGTYELSAGTLDAAGAYLGGGGVNNDTTFTHTGGTFDVEWFLYLGHFSRAQYTLSGTGALSAWAELLTYATMDHSAGTNTMDQYLSLGAYGPPAVYNLSGTGEVEAAWMTVGASGHGTMNQTGGTCTIDQHITVGTSGGADGLYHLSGTGQLTVTDLELLGIGSGSATFRQTGGTATVRGEFLVASDGQHPARLQLDAGTLEVGHLHVGGDTSMADVGEVDWNGGTLNAEAITVGQPIPWEPDGASTGRFRLAARADSGGLVKVLATKTLAVDTHHSYLDLADNALIVDYDPGATPLDDVEAWVASGWNSGAWDGTGIICDGDTGTWALGVADNADPDFPTRADLEGVPVDETSVLVRYTFYGNANLDDRVDAADLSKLLGHFGEVAADPTDVMPWYLGNFNYDDRVDAADLSKLLGNFGSIETGGTGEAPAGLGGMALAPEPATLALLALGAGAMLARRRRS